MGCTMSRISGSIDIIPRGLSHRMPFMAAMRLSPSVFPWVFFSASLDEVHAVIAADRYEVRTEVVRLLEVLDVFLVQRGVVRRGIIVRGHHPQHLIAHIVELVVVGEVARADDPDPGTGKAALGELLGEDAGLRAGKVDEGGI